MSRWTSTRFGIVAVTLLVALAAASPAAAAPDFQITEFGGLLANQDGSSATQAASHPYSMTTNIDFTPLTMNDPSQVREVQVELPAGLLGSPSATPVKCTSAQLAAEPIECPASAQVGVAAISWGLPPQIFPTQNVAIYNVTPPPGSPALFGFRILSQPAYLFPSVRTGGDYGLSVRTPEIAQILPIVGVSVTLWGVPADPSHDVDRGTPAEAGYGSGQQYCVHIVDPECSVPAGSPSKAFLTMPGNCSAGALTTVARAFSWQQPGVVSTASYDEDLNGQPVAMTGCENVPFDPDVEARPTTTEADAPTGLGVDITMPQDSLESPDALAQANLRKAVVTLPEGMTINPSSANGLAGCSDAQLGLKSAAAATCPPAAKIGAVTLETPLLEESLTGSVYVRTQSSGNPASGEMFRLAIVIDSEERGIRVKLAGAVVADPSTGRLTTTFDGNPQLPFSRLSVRLDSGPRAPLANPPTCGRKAIETELSPWSAAVPSRPTPDEAVTRSSSFTIPCPAMVGFAPSFRAGAVTAVGGAFSPFVVRIERPDRQQFIDGVRIDLPEGLLARLRGVPLCPEAQAAAGTCGQGSRVGSATIGAGPGARPFFLADQPVYLAGPYKGAPYSLSVAARAIAGPFDLGTVVVRQALHVDPVDAHITVVSDPLPTIVAGVPLRLRSVNVDVDRPRFTINPTSCAPKQIAATLHSQQGSTYTTKTRFQAADCQALAFKPRLAMRLTGRRQTRTGRHPGLRAVLTQGGGQAAIDSAKVTLPEAIVLDPKTSNDPKLLCTYEDGLKASCPTSSIIGRATAHSPILNRALSGPVHFVQGIRFDKKSGARRRTLPTLLVKLRGEVAIDLRAKSAVAADGRLVTTFPQVPDAPISRFSMSVKGGRKGILVVTGNSRGDIDICASRQGAGVELDAHNGRRADFPVRAKTPCARTGAR